MTTEPLFAEPEPPPIEDPVDVDQPSSWRHHPAAMRRVADAVRPYLAAHVQALDVAALALDAVEAPNEAH